VKVRHRLLWHFDPLVVEFGFHDGETGHVAAGLGQAVRQAGSEKIGMQHSHNRD
jgi:hypothetical protein